jgi:hypothetical protein
MSGSDEQPSVDHQVVVAPEDPTSPDAQRCLLAYFDELDRRFEGGFDAGRSIPATVDDLVEPAGLLLLARVGGEPVGAGAVKFHGSGPAELETNRSLTEAIRLYRSAGYVEVPAFNDEPYAHHWFEKDLSPTIG